MPPCWKSSSKSKKPCASTRTRPFLPNRNRSSCQTTACWYSSRRVDYTDRSYFYLPTPQNLSTKSAQVVENFNSLGAVVLPFWGHFFVANRRDLFCFGGSGRTQYYEGSESCKQRLQRGYCSYGRNISRQSAQGRCCKSSALRSSGWLRPT